jgi:autotransporter-associated beta strand protein
MYCGVLVLLFLITTLKADDYGVWSNWRYVYLITNSNGANVSGTVTKFPVLVRLDPSNFHSFASVSNSGADIRFTKADGTHLPYAIERWTNVSTTADTALIWVLVDTVKASDTTKIRMYWNQGSAADSTSQETVFATSNGFQAVWHLSEASGATMYDATTNNVDGLGLNGELQTAGRIGYGQSLDGTDDIIGCSNNGILNPGSSNFTVDIWTKRSSTANAIQTLFGKSNGGNPASDYGWLLSILSNVARIYLASGGTNWGDNGTFSMYSSTTITDTSSWHHIAAVIDKSSNSNCKLYIDGADVTTTSGTVTTVGSISNSYNCRIGAEADNQYYYTGKFDEARYSTVARSAAWVKLCYQNQLWSNGKDNFTRFSPSYYQPPRYTWDADGGTAGYQGGSSTWSTSTFTNWSQNNGTTRVVWPGSGYTANFAGSDGNYTITVDATQYLDSIAFDNGGYKINGGTSLYISRKLSGAVFGFSPPYAAGFDSAKAFDGNTSTFCDDAAASNGVTGIDLGSGNAERIAYIRFIARSGFTARMNGGKFQGSNDNSTWTDLYTVPSDPGASWQLATVSNTTAWRYLRYLGSAGGYCNIAEAEFYGMGSIYVASGKYDTIATVLAGNSGIRKYGDGYLTFSGANTYSGPTEIYLGTLQASSLANGSSNSSIGASSNSAGNLVLNGGTLRYIGGTVSCDRLFTLGTTASYIFSSGSGTLTFSNTGSVVFTGSGTRSLGLGGAYAGTHVFAPVIGDGTGGATSLAKSGSSSTWALTGTNTYTGTTTVTAGTLSIGNGGTTGAVSNSSSIDVTGTLLFNRSDNYTYTGVISGAGSIIKSGAGTVTLSGNLTHSGLTTVNAGTLRLTGTPTSNARKFVINSGGTISVIDRLNLSPVPASTTADWITLNGGTLSTGIASGQTYVGNRGFTLGASGGTINIPYTDNTNVVEIQSVITGSGSLTKTGIGVLSLYAANTFTGGVVVSGGVLRTRNTAALGNIANTITVNNGGCIDVYGTNIQGYTNNIIINGQVSSDTGALVNFGSDQQFAIRKISLGSNSSIGNNGGGRLDIGREIGGTCLTGNGYTLTKIGNNLVTLLGDGTTLGSVVASGGTLRLENPNAAGIAAITVNTGSELDSWWNTTFTNNLILSGGTLASAESNSYSATWSGAVSVTSASTLNSTYNNTTTLSGAITGTGSLTRNGTEGAFILSGNSNTYSGGTTISGGTLRVTNSSGSATGSGAVIVSSGGTLDGTGIISGATSISGTLSPGVNGPGRLTFGSNITFSSGATLNTQLNGTTASSGYDQVVMSTGTLSLGNATLSLTLGYTPAINDAFTIIDNAGLNPISGLFGGLAQGDTIQASYNGILYDCRISYTGGTGNDVVITVLRITEEDYANDWGYSQSILLNTTSTGANVSGNVLNFPVLLRLNPGNFDGFANTQPGGADIRFAKTNGAKLSYEIERWKDYDNNADTAEIWVKLDTVYGNNKTQTFVMYYGKSNAADSSSGSNVFKTTNGFLAAFHLGGNLNDATGGSSGTDNNSQDTGTGIIGKARAFDGSSQYFNAGDLADRSSGAVSFWFRPKVTFNSSSTTQGMYGKFTDNNNDATISLRGTGFLNGGTAGCIVTKIESGASGFYNSSTTSSWTAGTWYYLSYTWKNGADSLYINGSLQGSGVNTATITGSGNDEIGRSNYDANNLGAATYFNGTLDEFRIDSTIRSADWIRLCYENQKTDQTLISYEDYATWGFSRNITISTSGITTTNCLGFPLLVRLTSTTFDFNQARDSGQDIRFSKSNGVRLPYQIERWNKASNLAEIWVRVDTVYENNSSQYIKMYWGKSGVSSKSNSTNVFDTTNGFQAVWHLDESAGNVNDATINSYNASRSGNVAQTTGGVGYGQVFDGTDDLFTVNNLTKVLFGTVFTASAWIYIPNSVTSAGALWSQSDGDATWEAQETQFFLGANSTGSSQQGRYPQLVGHSRGWVNPTNALTTNAWNYVTVVYRQSDNTRQIVVNGVSETLTNTTYGGGTDPGTTFVIGDKISTDVNNDFNGSLDELRLENVVRSSDWIKLCYETQKSSPTIVTADSADAFRPLGIRRYGASSSPDSIYVGTNRWALRFAKNKGGGIKFLSSDTASSNQLDANLFYIVYKGHESDTGTGTLSLLDSSIVFSRIRQTKSVAGLPFNLDYTIAGSGKMFVRVSTTAISSLSGGLAFRIANNATTAYRNIAIGSTAATCEGVAHIDSTSGKYDLIMAPYDLWSDANQIETNSKYTGLSGTSWNPPAGKPYRWEFMIDFGHRTLADSAKIAKYIIDYRNSDTLGFYAGTPIMEQAWEEEEKGEWQFNEGSGSSVEDKTGRSHTATISGTPSWTTGKWNTNGIHLNGSDSVTVPHSTEFSGTNMQQTITAWIKPDALLSSSVAILKKYSSSGVGYSFTGGTSGTLRFNMANGGSVVQLQSNQVITPGSWYYAAATMYMLGQTDYLALYINGKLDTLRNVELDSYYGTNTSNVVIGENFTGTVDDVRYYNQLLTEDEIRAMSLKGFSPERGMYRLRANNDNTIHTMMHGAVYNRFLPVMQISNYWATALPTYVYVDGTGLVSGTDYYAALDDNRNQLTIGFNRTINRSSTIFIDNNLPTGQKENGPTKKMYWGISGSSNEYFWVKNTSGRYFGAASANEFYINWKMNTASTTDGEIWQMRSSVTNPYTYIDTSTGTNLVPGNDGNHNSILDYCINIDGHYPRSTCNVSNAFTYAIEESSQVRVRVRVNERQATETASFRIVTRWTIYPTGQIYRYDSLYSFSGTVWGVFAGCYLDDSTYASTSVMNKAKKRAFLQNSQTYPDFVTAWLSMKNTNGHQAYPFDADTIATNWSSTRVGFDFLQYMSAPAKWSSAVSPVQSVLYFDFHHAAMNSSSMDSIANGIQCTRFSTRRALSMITGAIDSTTEGDFSDGVLAGGDNNGDGFNEMEGAYIINASSNTVAFKLPAYGDTCRYYPAFRIKNYTSVNKPKYVFLFKGLAAGDTVALLDGYQYNSYVNTSTDELLFQIDSIFCDSVGIYISSDKTLAVELSKFEARSGNRSDTLLWRTESEQGNLGFQLFRRIKPEFYDSIVNAINSSTISESQQHDSDEVISLFKRKTVTDIDTGWVVVNKELIAGAPSGNSEGPRDYRYIDRNLFNGILFEYRLIAIDEKLKESSHGPVAVMPRKFFPLAYMLGANFPNPFIYSTAIRFALPVESKVKLKIFTLQGRLVKNLIKPDQKYSADYHMAYWDGKNDQGLRCAPGPFIYLLEAEKFSKAKVMLMIH